VGPSSSATNGRAWGACSSTRTTGGAGGVNLAIGKDFAASLYGSKTADSFDGGATLRFAGLGLGGGYGETWDRLRFDTARDETGTWRVADNENATRSNAAASLPFLGADAGRADIHKVRALQRASDPGSPVGWLEGVFGAQALAGRARGIDQASDIDLAELAAGEGLGVHDEYKEQVGVDAGLDNPLLGLHGGWGRTTGGSRDVEVRNLGDGYRFTEGRSEQQGWGLSGGYQVTPWIGLDVDRSAGEGTAASDTYTVDPSAQAAGQRRLDSGLVPGAVDQASGWDGVVARARLQMVEAKLPKLQSDLAEARKEGILGLPMVLLLEKQIEDAEATRDASVRTLNDAHLDAIRVGEELAPGVRKTGQVRRSSSEDGTDRRGELFGLHMHKRNADARRLTTDTHLDAHGRVVQSEQLSTSRERGTDYAETLDLLTSSDAGAPALAFSSASNIEGSGALSRAAREDDAAVPAAAGALDVDHEQLRTDVALSHDQAAALADELNHGDRAAAHWSGLQERLGGLMRGDVRSFTGAAMVQRLSADRDALLAVDGPEAFDRLSPEQQVKWVRASNLAGAGEGGHSFDSLAAIERIADPDKKRDLYAELVDDAMQRGVDVGDEYRRFAAKFEGSPAGAVAEGSARARLTNPGVEAAAGHDVATQAQYLRSFPSWSESCRDVLRGAALAGGPAQVEEVLQAAGWSVGDVWYKLARTEDERRWMLETLQGTVMGAQLDHLLQAADAEGPLGLADAVRRAPELVADAEQIDAPGDAPAATAAGRRVQAVQRGLRQTDGSETVLAAVQEAAAEGPAALRALVDEVGADAIARLAAEDRDPTGERLRETLRRSSGAEAASAALHRRESDALEGTLALGKGLLRTVGFGRD